MPEEVNLDIDADESVKKPLTNDDADVSQVRFISSNADKNGDMVIVNEGKARKSGLTKEELMKYANDPFWVRLRMTLFVLFWVLWLSMFVGAIVIIVLVPKCPASSRLKWYQRSTMYQINVKALDEGNKSLVAVAQKLDYFNNLNVETLILSAVQGESLIEVNPALGTIEQFKELVDKVEKNTGSTKNVMIELDIRYTSVKNQWFTKSISNDSEYANHYIWREAKPSVGNWIFNAERNAFYLAPIVDGKSGNDYAHLDLSSPQVVNSVKNAVQFWKEKKVNGLKIVDADQLFPPEAFPDDPKKDIEFIKDVRKHLYTKVDTSGKTALLVEIRNVSRSSEFIIKSTADLVVTRMLTSINGTSTGDAVAQKFKDYYSSMPEWPEDSTKVGPWSGCAIAESTHSLASRVSQALVDSLLMISFMAPNCTQIVNGGDELGLNSYKINWNETQKQLNATQSHLKTFQSLIQLRNENKDSLWMGHAYYPFSSREVFTIARFYPDNKGFLAAINFGAKVSFKLEPAAYLPDDGEVVLVNSQAQDPLPPKGPIKLKEEITIGEKQAILVQFTPIGGV